MRTLFSVLTLLVSTVSFAQSNNPFNQNGIDVISSMEIIQNDFNKGEISELNQETLDRYVDKLPVKGSISLEKAAEIMEGVKSEKFSVTGSIENSSLSKISKDVLMDVFSPSEPRTKDQLQDVIKLRVEDIKESELEENEKEVVLSLLAVVYNSTETSFTPSSKEQKCVVNGPDGSGGIDNWVCGAIFGGVIGSFICGWPCAGIGAVVGGIVGALT